MLFRSWARSPICRVSKISLPVFLLHRNPRSLARHIQGRVARSTVSLVWTSQPQRNPWLMSTWRIPRGCWELQGPGSLNPLCTIMAVPKHSGSPRSISISHPIIFPSSIDNSYTVPFPDSIPPPLPQWLRSITRQCHLPLTASRPSSNRTPRSIQAN